MKCDRCGGPIERYPLRHELADCIAALRARIERHDSLGRVLGPSEACTIIGVSVAVAWVLCRLIEVMQ